MNVWNEKYPGDFEGLLVALKECSSILLTKLNSSVCSDLNSIHQWDEGTQKVRLLKNGNDLFSEHFNVKMKSTSIKNDEVKGVYLFGQETSEGLKPVYVGISGSIMRRLKQHCWGKEHNQASLAYLMAKKEHGHVGRRKLLPLEQLVKQQEIIRQFKFVIYPELDDYKLYFLEVYLSGVLKTKWNSFKTH
jgi:hypothetical protein